MAQPLQGNILLDASGFSGGVLQPCTVLSFKASVSETLFKFRAERNYRVERAWCVSATCYVAKVSFTSTQDTATGYFSQIVRLTSSAIVYPLEMELLQGEVLFIDVAGSSCVTVSIRPV